MRTLVGSSILTYHYTMPPVSNPENWNWTTFSFAPMVGFAMHNAPYRITVQWRYGVYMKGARGPFQTSITIHVQNLVVTSPDVGKVLRWDPEKGITDTSFSYKIECAQKKQVSVRVRIYDLSGNVVYEVTEQKLCPGGYSFSWDGTMNTGYYGYPPEEGSNPAPAGLYTFDVEVEANPYDKDAVRSKALRVERLPGRIVFKKEYYDFWYELTSNRNARSGVYHLYDPDLAFVAIGFIDGLECLAHGMADGLIANPSGVQHGVLTHIPWDWMHKTGRYRCILHFCDNHSDFYKDHTNKLALPIEFEVCVPEAHNYDGNDTLYSAAAAEYHQKELPDGSAYRAQSWTNADPHDATNRVKGVTIVYIVNHGWQGGGGILINGTGGWVAQKPQGINLPGYAFINENDFSSVNFVGFVGCDTALTETTNGYGNLLDAAVSRGATTALGFAETIYFGSGFGGLPQTWTSEFWAAALGWLDINPPDGQWDAPMTVLDAARHATWVMELKWGNDYGYNSYAFRGITELILAPARCKN